VTADYGGAELVWELDAELTESPVWDPARRRVLFISKTEAAPRGHVHAYGVDDGSTTTWDLPERAGSVGLCRSGRLIVALERRVASLDLETGTLADLSPPIAEPPGNVLNDGRPGPDGCFWVGTVDARRPLLHEGTAVDDPNGCLYRLRPDGVLECRSAGYLSFNGAAFSPDGKTLYCADTAIGRIDAWDLDPEYGPLTARRRLATVPAADGRPDGAAVDIDGNYWSAGITAGCINQLSPAGQLKSRIPTPCAAPTMPCFGGGFLFFTSMRGVHRDASRDLDQRPQNVAGLFRMVGPAVGAPVDVFADDRAGAQSQ
jgi:sugar lactone lactonase YvrE